MEKLFLAWALVKKPPESSLAATHEETTETTGPRKVTGANKTDVVLRCFSNFQHICVRKPIMMGFRLRRNSHHSCVGYSAWCVGPA